MSHIFNASLSAFTGIQDLRSAKCSGRIDGAVEPFFIERTRTTQDTCFIRDLKIQLKDIPEQLTIEDKDFHLRGAINYYSQGRSVTSVGHYTAYCWRASIDSWQYFDGMKKETKYVRNTTKINAQLLIYTV